MLNIIMLIVIVLSVAFIYYYAECHNAECHYAECRGATEGADCTEPSPSVSISWMGLYFRLWPILG
jgi:hypothetical protein